jgi:hypothetical protein
MHNMSSRREAGATITKKRGLSLRPLLGALFALAGLSSSCQPAFAAPPATCVVSGTVLNISAQPVPNTQVRFRVVQPTIINGNAIAAQDLTAITAGDGTWSLTLIQGLNAQVDIPAAGTPVSSDTVIPTGGLCPATFASLTLYTRGTLTPATILSNAGPSMGGDLTGASPSPSVIGLRGVALTAGTPSNGQGWVYNSGTGKYVLTAIGGVGVASVTGGTGISITGSGTAPVVNIAAGGVTSTQLGSGAASTNVGALGGALSGSLPSPSLAAGAAAGNLGGAGGVLAGTYPSPTFAAGGIADAAVNAGAAIQWSKISKAGSAESDITGLSTDLADKLSKSTGGTVAGPMIFSNTVAMNGGFSFTGSFTPGGEIRVARTADATSGSPLKPSNNLTLEGSVWTTVAERRLTAWINTPTGANAGHMSLMGYSTDNVLGPERSWFDTITGAFNGNVIGNVTGAVTGNVTGNASGTAGAFTSNLTGDVTSSGMATTVALVNGSTAANVHAAELLANAATAANTASTIMRRDGSNQVAATTFTGALVGNVIGNASGTAANITGVAVVANGGTGASTLAAGLLHGNGAGAITSAQANLTSDVTNVLPVANGGTGQTTASAAFSALDPMALLGDTMYGGAAGVATQLLGNTTTTRQFLNQTGNGTISAAPAWGTLVAGDLPNHDFSKVTTGIVPIAQGGTGQSAAGLGYNALAPTTTLGDIAFSNGAGTNTRLAGSISATKAYLQQTGNGAISAAPVWSTIAVADVPALPASQITSGTFSAGLIPNNAANTSGSSGTTSALLSATTTVNVAAAAAPTNGQVLTATSGTTATWQTATGTGTITGAFGSGGSTGMTLTGGAASGSVTLTLGGTLGIANGGTNATTTTGAFNALSPMTVLGDVIFGGASGAGTRLSGNTSTTPMFLRSTGAAGLATVPTFSQVNASTDLAGTLPVNTGGTGAATLTGLLRGTGTTAITGGAQASLTTEVTGLLPVANGGSGVGTLTGFLKGNGTSAFSAVANVVLTTDVGATILPVVNGGTGTAAGTILGDVTGTIVASTVAKIQGRTVVATAPSDLQYLGWNNGASQWEPKTVPSASTVVLRDGSTPMSANWPAGNFIITSQNSVNSFNVLEYGCVGDDTHDDTACINSAISAATFATHGKVIIPGAGTPLGRYKVTSMITVPSSVTIEGEAPGYGAGLANLGVMIHAVHTGNAILSLVGSANVTLKNLILWGDSTTTPKTGLLLGRNSAASAGAHYFENVAMDNAFSVAAVYSIASEENVWQKCLARVLNGGALYGFYTSQSDDLSIGGLTASSNLSGQYNFLECDVRTASATTSALYIKVDAGAQGHYFNGGYLFAQNGSYVTVETNGTTNGGISFVNVSGENIGTPVNGFRLITTGGAAKTLQGLMILNCPMTGIVGNYINQGANLTIKDSFIKTQAPGAVSSTFVPNQIINSYVDTGTTPGTFYGVQAGIANAVVGGTIFKQTANSTTTANVQTTMFGTGVGSLTLPANSLAVGTTIRIHMGGFIAAADGGASTKTIQAKLGGVIVTTGSSGNAFTTVLNQPWFADATFTCRTTGATGTVIGTSEWQTQIGATQPNGVIAGNTGVAVVNTQGTLAIDFQLNNGNAAGTATTTWATVEILN